MYEVEVNGKLVGVYVVVQDKPGIVTVKCGIFYCLTCEKNYCDHARHVSSLSEDEQHSSHVIARLVNSCAQSSQNMMARNRHTVFSKTSISFSPNEHMARVLRKLCAANELSSLSPSNSVNCHCGCNAYVSCVLYKEADLITSIYVGKVQGT